MACESEGIIISIPPDIITDILLRLPVKSLGQLKCVSKNFVSLVSDPKFIKAHLRTLKRNHIIFTDVESELLYSHPFDHHEKALLTPTKFHLETDRYNFCGSCDGLVLMYRWYPDFSNLFVLYNPTTRDFVELPYSGYDEMMDDYSEYHKFLQTDTMEGFGYDSVHDDYKVVTITFFRYSEGLPNCVFVHVYSLRTNAWSLLIDSAYDYSYVDNSYENDKGVFVNGFVHWITKNNSKGLQVIIAFSLDDEIFSELPSPNLCNDVNILSKKDCTLFVLGEKLYIFVKNKVWLMNEYGNSESWTRFFVPILDQIPIRRRMNEEPRVLYDNGRLLVAYEDRMYIYDVEKRAFSKTVYYWNSKNFLVEGTCVESLVSPKFNTTN